MSFPLKKINNVQIEKVKLEHEQDKRPILGFEMFPEIYANIFICAKKKSGKSTVIYNILKRCTGKYTKIIAFVGTLHKDATWMKIKNMCKKNGIYFEGHTSFKDKGRDLLADLLEALKNEYPEGEDDEEKKEQKPKNPIIICDGDSDEEDEEDEEEYKKKSKTRAPDYIFILDDLSRELKNPNLEEFLKMNRHFNAKIIVSNQYLSNIAPESRKQLDYWLLFKGQPKHKLEEIYVDADVSIPIEDFLSIYKNATEIKYSFLYIDTGDATFRKKFDEQYSIKE